MKNEGLTIHAQYGDFTIDFNFNNLRNWTQSDWDKLSVLFIGEVLKTLSMPPKQSVIEGGYLTQSMRALYTK